jgi:anti-sigma factor RsiW
MSRRDLPEDWLQRYVDGELSAPERSEAETRLLNDPALAREARRLEAENAALRAMAPAPDRQHLAALNATVRAARAERSAPLRIAAMVALFAVGIGTGWGVAGQKYARDLAAVTSDATRFVAAAAAAHRLYSVEVLHPVEVTAGEKDHLNAWLSNRLGGPIAAPELSGSDYRLVGGRLLPEADNAAAQFMYEDGSGERMTLFVTAEPGSGASGLRFQDAPGGITTVTWQDGTWRYALVGEASRSEMETLARQMHGNLI